uniref:NADH dehydrogenase subunit 5 n=1 Tax=Dactylogyrus simplex TaxID=2736736 RepID=UPI002E794B58|nr:NADH dehydrogenase subunit 5 [Dactylogyrus simplex]WPS93112.1 NADH dehydrogenase subunit 5 [Dactylogyrus simplex]
MNLSLVLICWGAFIVLVNLSGVYAHHFLELGNNVMYPLGVSLGHTEYAIGSMLFFCGLLSLSYSAHYFGGVLAGLNKVIYLFLLVMGGLASSNDILTSLSMWEYLGFVSFLLILYYSNYDTSYAAAVTITSSRAGDVGLFFIFAAYFGSLWNGWILAICFFLVVATKSAVIPFTSWLLEAMRAPTPVSCLVHSSTLVAAGVWFIVNYGHWLDTFGADLLLMACVCTIIVSAYSALYFTDIKKIVALSTANNIAWCTVYYIMGHGSLCVIQLVSHGVAKCLLFMGVGDILSGSFGSQNLSSTFKAQSSAGMGWVGVAVLVLGIAGTPFQGVFFTKHLLLGGLGFNSNVVLGLALFYSVYLTYWYSARLLLLMGGVPGGVNNWIANNFAQVACFLVLATAINYSLSSNLSENNSLGGLASASVAAVQAGGLWSGLRYSSFNNSSAWYSALGGQDVIVKASYSWWLDLISSGSSLFYFRGEVAVARGVVNGNPSMGYLFTSSGLSVLLGLLGMIFVFFW